MNLYCGFMGNMIIMKERTLAFRSIKHLFISSKYTAGFIYKKYELVVMAKDARVNLPILYSQAYVFINRIQPKP